MSGTTTQPGDGLAALYPFLYGGGDAGPAGAVAEEARASTAAKLAEIAELRRRVLTEQTDELVACARATAAALAGGATVFTFGNGGSSTDAAALAGLFRASGSPAVALTSDTATVTALANDIGFDNGLARQLVALARPGDVAVGLSTSGNSENLVQAFAAARRARLLTVGLAGHDGGRMAADGAVAHLFVVPSSSVHRIQEAQTTLYQVYWRLTQVALAHSTEGADRTEPQS